MPRIHVKVDGSVHHLEIAAGDSLLDALRKYYYFQVKRGCETGECGACTVIMDGYAVLSCLVFAAQADGHEVLTVAGLASGGVLDPVQQAFMSEAGMQCGFCIPGVILSARALLSQCHNPTEEQIRNALAGNLCRCTGYRKIVDTILHIQHPNDSRANCSGKVRSRLLPQRRKIP
jgi:carbon-monoxide dehydrogenase small subunit